MCDIEQVIEELSYAKQVADQQKNAVCLDIGGEIAKLFLIEYQDVYKVTIKFVNELGGGEYSTSKTKCEKKEQGCGICANNDPSGKIAIFRDYLSYMGEATIYRAAAETQYRFNNYYGRGVDALVTRLRSTCVSAMHQFTPLYSIYFL